MKAKGNTTDRFVIIMAGGKGERFWPVSREKRPKQLITLLGDRSFLQQAVDRVLPLAPLKNILVITNTVQAPEVRRQLPKLPKENDLKRLLKTALLSGSVFFRGNDRNPDDTVEEIETAVENILEQSLPEVFDRFSEGAAKVRPQDLASLLTTENLRGLTQVFTDLNLVYEDAGRTVLRTDVGPLAEVLALIQNRTAYGESATGRYLSEEFAREPFGWDFDVVRLFVACLLRAGLIEATSQGQTIDSALTLAAKNTFTKAPLFFPPPPLTPSAILIHCFTLAPRPTRRKARAGLSFPGA